MAEIIDGRAVADEVLATVRQKTAELKRSAAVTPGIAVVIVGEDPASQVYVNSKSRMARDSAFIPR